MKTLTKENILAKVNGYDLLNHYLKPYHTNGLLRQGQLISNPFLSEKQKNTIF